MLSNGLRRPVCLFCRLLGGNADSSTAQLHTTPVAFRQINARTREFRKNLELNRILTTQERLRPRREDELRDGPPRRTDRLPSYPSYRRESPLPRRSEQESSGPAPTTLQETCDSLVEELRDWSRSTYLIPTLVALGVDAYQARELVPHFCMEAQRELHELRSNPEGDSAEYWYLEKVMDLMTTMNVREGAKRAFLWRFMDWAPRHVVAPTGDGQNLVPTIGGRRVALDDDPSKGPLGQLLKIGAAVTKLSPAHDFPDARALRRKIILHVGPTNSGKTYHALRAMVNSSRGLYAGPLRLLAHEIWERVNSGSFNGVPTPCNLFTGEEQRIVDELAGFVSCTVEMAPIHLRFDVAVIDEIQMIGDPQRGFGWTNALLGLQADEIHVCGEDTVVDLITELGRQCGDEVIVNRYERLTPLSISDESLYSDIKNVRPGDCVVAFSRSRIFALRTLIQKATGMKCVLAYGALPPEVRSEQARLFNDPNSGYDVMVASDAVGMGLNLQIKRVIFEAMSKWVNNVGEVDLSASQVKQIAGRAGRFGMNKGQGGEVTTLHAADVPKLRHAMAVPNTPVTRALMGMGVDSVTDLVNHLPPETSLMSAFEFANTYGRVGMLYSIASIYLLPKFETAGTINDLSGLTIAEQYTLINAPWPDPKRLPLVSGCCQSFIRAFSESSKPVRLATALQEEGMLRTLTSIMENRDAIARDEPLNGDVLRVLNNPPSLVLMESMHKVICFYLWLSYRLPMHFPDQAYAFEVKKEVEDAAQILLAFEKKKKRRKAADADLDVAPPSDATRDDRIQWNHTSARQRGGSIQISFGKDGQVEGTTEEGGSFTLRQPNSLTW